VGRIAFFTGAGASRAIGYPLTRELLQRIRQALRAGTLFRDTTDADTERAQRDELRKHLTGLLPGFERIDEAELPLITDVFSLVEYAIVSGESLSIGGDDQLRRCRDLLKYAMTDIFLEDFESPYDARDPQEQRQSQVLSGLTRWIAGQGSAIGLITTNYDIGIEHALRTTAVPPEAIDMGFDWRDPDSGIEHTRPQQPALRIYKLHGSFDLLRCRCCGYVYFNSNGSIAHQVMRKDLDHGNTCHCRDDLRLELQIVSPSLVRDIRDANLLSIWRSALEWMRNAEEWVIAGYSLPPEDLAIRSLLLRAHATAPKGNKPRITVVQVDDKARPNYRVLFPDCTYRTDGLEGFLSDKGES
jgi:NAD-dependent SIR2 family protein deacetylase